MGIANSNFIKAGVKVLTTFLDVINAISGALGDSAIGQGFEALFKIGLAFAAWQLLPKIIGKVFNHLAKDIVGFGVEQAAMAAETETVGARMSATLAEIKAQFASTAAAASAMSAEVVAAEEAMAAGTTAAAAEMGAANATTIPGVFTVGTGSKAGVAASGINLGRTASNKPAAKVARMNKIDRALLGLGLTTSALELAPQKTLGGRIAQQFGDEARAGRKAALPGLLGKSAKETAQAAKGMSGLNKALKLGEVAIAGFGTAMSAIPFGGFIAAAGAVVAAIWGIAKVVKTPKERMEEANKVLENYQEQTKKIRTSREGVSSIEDEFKALATGVDNAGKNIGLTTKQYERYKELVNELIKIHPSLVKGYDKNGQAIINNATAIKEINKALDEQEQRAIRKVTTDKNMNKILKGQIAVIRENNKELGAAASISSD